jgi:two-component system, NarL family, nitrate/nitrite response regulator NarL
LSSATRGEYPLPSAAIPGDIPNGGVQPQPGLDADQGAGLLASVGRTLGYIPKSGPPRTILTAVQFALAGNVYVPTLMAEDTAGAPEAGDHSLPKSGVSLTSRQIDVLRLLCEGRSNKEIGRALGVSQKTVKDHVTAIFKALNVANRIQAAAMADKAGLI